MVDRLNSDGISRLTTLPEVGSNKAASALGEIESRLTPKEKPDFEKVAASVLSRTYKSTLFLVLGYKPADVPRIFPTSSLKTLEKTKEAIATAYPAFVDKKNIWPEHLCQAIVNQSLDEGEKKGNGGENVRKALKEVDFVSLARPMFETISRPGWLREKPEDAGMQIYFDVGVLAYIGKTCRPLVFDEFIVRADGKGCSGAMVDLILGERALEQSPEVKTRYLLGMYVASKLCQNEHLSPDKWLREKRDWFKVSFPLGPLPSIRHCRPTLRYYSLSGKIVDDPFMEPANVKLGEQLVRHRPAKPSSSLEGII